jgi:two-component system chemotaxis response regulator CheY
MIINHLLPALVVDDFRNNAAIAARVLNQMGFKEVDTAETGQEALAKARIKRYGLIVSDLHMKPMSGAELIWHLKSDPRTASIPTIVLTGDPLEGTKLPARQAGATSFVQKPPTPGMLRDRLEAAIAGRATA